MSAYDLDPTTKTHENAHFWVHVEDDFDGTFGLLIEPKEGDISARHIVELATARGFLAKLDCEYRSRSSASRSARRLLDGPLNRP